MLIACAVQPEFVNHLVSVLYQTSLSEIHRCWMVPTVCGMRTRAKKIPSLAYLGISTQNRAHTHQAHFRVGWAFTAAAATATAVRGFEVLLDAPCASLPLPVVRRLRLSFRSPVPSSILQEAVVQVTVAEAVAQAATPGRCYCGCCIEHPMLMAREAASLRPQGDVSCAKTPSRPVPRRFEQNAPGLAPVSCALQCSSQRLPRLSSTGSCVGTSRASVCVAKLFEVGSAQWRSSHLSEFMYQRRQRNCFVWRSDPNSTANIFQCIWCQFAAECFVQQAATPSFKCSVQRAQTTVGWLRKHPPPSLTELC